MSVMDYGAPPAGGADPLLALLGGATPPPPPGGGASTTSSPEEVDSLKQLLGLSQRYLEIPSVTEQERAQVTKCMSVFQKLLADNERAADQILGASMGERKALAPGG